MTLRSKLLFAASGLIVLIALFLGGILASYYDAGPFNKTIARVERKIQSLSGAPDPLAQRYNLFETTNVRLRGTVYRIPRDERSSGGALATWGDTLLVMNRRGTVRHLTEGEEIVPTGIMLPDNGRLAYEAVAADPAYADFVHRPQRHRYNDLMLVDGPDRHGLALSYSFFDADRVCYGSRVAWLDVPRTARPDTFEASPDDWDIIFETTPCLPLNPTAVAFDGIMAGGRMDFAAPDTLYVGVGEYYLDGVHSYDVGIQSPETDYGKVIALNLTDGTATHHSVGHRNLQGVTLDLEGRLWTTEHMIRGGDELNLIEEGGNYGWPLETYGSLYSGLPFPNAGGEGRHDIHRAPAYAWLPSAGVSSLTVVDGFHPAWNGDLLVGALAGPEYGRSLFRIRVENEAVTFAERIRIGGRIRYVTQWGPNRIALLIDNDNIVVVLRAEERIDALGRALARLSETMEPELHTQVAQVAKSCNECHGFESEALASAPSLAGVIGRGVGLSNYASYSSALADHGGVWDRELLAAYIIDPNAVMPGTLMPAQGLTDGPVLTGLIDLLEIVGQIADEDLKYN